MTVPPEALVAKLESDLDTHLITLKFLGLFQDRSQARLVTDHQDWASLLWFDGRLFAWDREVYPEARFIVFADGTSPGLIGALLADLPPGHLIVKTSDPRAKTAVEKTLGLAPVRRFLWYTDQGRPPLPSPEVRQTTVWEPELEALMIEGGYTAREQAELRTRGARWYVAEAQGRIQSLCMVYPNHGPIWEVGALKTRAEARRQGYGRRVAEAAVASILSRGHRVRYHVDAENLASQALAEQIGLGLHVEARHYVRQAAGALNA